MSESLMTSPSPYRPRILLVEDQPVLRELMQRALDADGYEVLTAANGRAAVLLVASLDLPVDLLITDLGMPLIGGEALIAELARYHRPPPVLFVSGLGPEPGQPEPMLHKPFSLDELCARVRSLLGQPEVGHGGAASA